MKKLNLLTRAEMKEVMGGLEQPKGKCNIRYNNGEKGAIDMYMPYYFGGSCVDQQVQAQVTCIRLLEKENVAGDRCAYDCACDGVNPNF